MKRLYGRLVLAGLLLLALCLGGCSRGKKASGEENTYQIYYLNAAVSRLVARDYAAQSREPDQLIGELMEQFLQVPADLEAQAALSDKVVYQGFRQEDMVLYLYFDNNYASMRPEREILCRAALARTLTQVEGVDYINIYSGDQPLMDSSQMPVGMISASDFVDSITDVNAYEKTELTLYFTDENGVQLFPETRTVVHNINTSVERVVIDELIEGPESSELRPTLDPSTVLLSLSVNENVCYVNFDASFLNNSLEVMDYIPIYSIVNSLAAQSAVNRVQITVDGDPNVLFRDSISLDTLFERNLDYIGGTEN